jgi:hypothetical protein
MCRGALVLLLAVAAGQRASAQAALLPRFNTHAAFVVDRDSLSLITVIATIEPSRTASDHSWVRVYFYAFPPDTIDAALATRGSVASMDRKWQSTSVDPKEYNRSRAVLQLTVDKDDEITQVDLSVPGYACTVASTPQELNAFVQRYAFDGKQLRLAAKGAYVCGSGKQTVAWSVDVDTPVASAEVRR